jgi:hypothetical protein
MAERNDGFKPRQDFKRLADVLNGAAEKLDGLAETLKPDNEEIRALSANRTAEAIQREEELAARIAGPLVNALDSISGIISSAALEINALALEAHTPLRGEGNDAA